MGLGFKPAPKPERKNDAPRRDGRPQGKGGAGNGKPQHAGKGEHKPGERRAHGNGGPGKPGQQRGQGHGQVAHQRAVAAIARVAGARQAAVVEVTQDAAPAGVADVHRLGLEPANESLAHGVHQGIVALGMGLQGLWAALQQRLAQGQAHGGVVGDLSARELEPAAAHDVAVHTVLQCDLARPHELHRRTQGVADGQTQVGAEQLVEALSHSVPPRRNRRRARPPPARPAAPCRAAGRERPAACCRARAARTPSRRSTRPLRG